MKKHNAIRLIVAVLAIVMMISCIPMVSADSGGCGENLQWSFSGGTLTITGSGAMTDYSEANPAPWYSLREQIVNLSLPEGLTRVGNYAFAQCNQLISVKLPSTVTEVGKRGFFACENLQFLTLSSNLVRIEDAGFERCLNLPSVTLPYGLQYIGYQAFWRCESLMSITVPETVTHLDMAVFAYCYSLVRAQIDAPIRELPQWLFYECRSLGAVTLPAAVKAADEYAFHGCDNLNTVYYAGSRQDANNLASDIADYLDGFGYANINAGGSNIAANSQEDGDQRTNTIVTKTEGAEVGTQTTQQFPEGSTKPSSTQTQVSATITGQSGWSDVVNQTEELLEIYGNQLQEGQKVPVTVYVPDGVTMDSAQLAALAGKPVELTVQTAEGSVWTVDCSDVTAQTLKDNLELSYTLTAAGRRWRRKLGGAETYLLKFRQDMQINATVQVRIPTLPVRSNAFLYQKKGGSLKLLQASVVDDNGYAHFYLGAVDSKTKYFIGIDVPGESADNVMVPKPLEGDYLVPPMQSIDYVITGRKSSWGMHIGQITWILIGVVVGCVVVVGGTVYLMNKRKLRNGYVPNLDNER